MLTRQAIQQWVSSLAARRSASVTLRAVGILKGVCDDAVYDGIIPRNPCTRLELPHKTRGTHSYLTMSQLLTVAHACGRYEPLILTLGLTGLRWGEATALTCKDVNLKTRRITVDKTVTRVNGRMIVGTPKNGRSRMVAYPALLQPYYEKLTSRGGDSLLFQGPSGGYVPRPHAPRRKGSWWNKACRQTGIPPLRLHDLRHTAASLMVSAGANVKVVQRQLGHASASMTLDVYADLFDRDLDTVASALNQLAHTV